MDPTREGTPAVPSMAPCQDLDLHIRNEEAHRDTKGKNLNSAAGLDAKIWLISVPSCGLRIWQRLTLDLDGAHRGIDRSAFEQYAN